MSGITYKKDNALGTLREIVPLASEDVLREIIEKKRNERIEVVRLLIQRENEAAKVLPKEAREFIKIPDIKVLLDDI